MSAFGALLRELRLATIVTVERANGSARWPSTGPISQNELAIRVGVDPAYVNRIERGLSPPPRRRIVEQLADGLEADSLTRARLFVAAGYWPWAPNEIDDPTALVAVVLAVAEGDYRRVVDDRHVREAR